MELAHSRVVLAQIRVCVQQEQGMQSMQRTAHGTHSTECTTRSAECTAHGTHSTECFIMHSMGQRIPWNDHGPCR
eukprot:2980893-Rhodomonas_salina.1